MRMYRINNIPRTRRTQIRKTPSQPPKGFPVAKQKKRQRNKQRSQRMKALPRKTLVTRTCQMIQMLGHQKRKKRKEKTRPPGKRQRLRQKRKDNADTRTVHWRNVVWNNMKIIQLMSSIVIQLRPIPYYIINICMRNIDMIIVYFRAPPKTNFFSDLLAYDYLALPSGGQCCPTPSHCWLPA